MMGVQWTQTNLDQFFISLYSGLLANIITAIIGGLIVWFIISQIDKRRLRRQHEREVARFRENLRFALDKIEVFELKSITHPPQLANVLTLELKEYPLNIWHENVPKEEKLFVTIRAFQRTYSEFIVFSGKFQVMVQKDIWLFNWRHKSRLTDSFYEQYLVGKILLMEEDVRFLIEEYKDLLPLLEKANKEILSQGHLQKPQEDYRTLREELGEAARRVKYLL